jgi:hypothetical protein
MCLALVERELELLEIIDESAVKYMRSYVDQLTLEQCANLHLQLHFKLRLLFKLQRSWEQMLSFPKHFNRSISFLVGKFSKSFVGFAFFKARASMENQTQCRVSQRQFIILCSRCS